MYGMKCFSPVLDVKTDCIYDAVCTGKCIGDRPLIVNIGFDRLNLRIIRTEQLLAPFRMS